MDAVTGAGLWPTSFTVAYRPLPPAPLFAPKYIEMMRAVDALRQKVAPSIGGALGYAPVELSDDEEEDSGREACFEFELGPAGDDFLGEGRRRRRPRKERDAEEGSGELSPQYTPLYSNMKVLRRKRLDASMGYYRAGPCECYCAAFVLPHFPVQCAPPATCHIPLQTFFFSGMYIRPPYVMSRPGISDIV